MLDSILTSVFCFMMYGRRIRKGEVAMLRRSLFGSKMFFGVCLCFLMVVLFSGCVANQTIALSYYPDAHEKIISSYTVKSEVVDERLFIKDGNKSPSYLGHFRASFGNTWDVTTTGRVALAKQFAIDILKELKALGFKIDSLAGDRMLKVDILKYNFDAYINGKFWYKIRITVLDSAKKTLAESIIEDTHIIKGSTWVGPAGAFKKELPEIYQGIIEKIIRENDVIVKAL